MINPIELSQWDLALGPTSHNKLSCPYLLIIRSGHSLSTVNSPSGEDSDQ